MGQLYLKNIFIFSALISIITFIGCEKKGTAVIDSTGNAPTITDAKYNIAQVNTDNIYIDSIQRPNDVLLIESSLSVRVTHPASQKMIKGVYYQLSNPEYVLISEGILSDNGILPDLKSNDSIYTIRIKLQIKRVDLGTYFINLWSEDINGYTSNIFILPIKIIRLNHPPTISNLQAQNNLTRGSTLRLTLQVSDLDGLSDIYLVGFTSLKPDGKYANNGNLIPMFDDGNPNNPSGDANANDGIYTYTTNVPTDAMAGTYTYTFFALDKIRSKSDSIIHRINIQ